jgi:hypothetical protein
MASFYIEDKYFEAKLDDGSVVYTRTRFIVDALKYYRSECLKFIENGERQIKETPRLLVVNSFEDAMKRIDRITDTQVKIRKAYDMVEKIDNIFRNLANGSSQNEPSK